MTAYSVDALNQLKKDIAGRAIKWMLYQDPTNWDGNADEGFYGASWEGTLPPVSGPTGVIRLKWYPPGLGVSAGQPPGLRHVGEGYDAANRGYYEYEVDPWVDIYQPWIEAVDQVFYGWDNIPDPADFEGPRGKLQDAVVALAFTPTDAGQGGDYQNAGLAGDLGVLRSWTGGALYEDGAAGQLAGAFARSYHPDRIQAVLNNQLVGLVALGVAIEGEKAIWAKAREDIMAFAERAKEAMDGPGGGGELDLTVVKALYGVAENFLPPGVSQAIEVGKDTVTLLDALIPDKDPPDPKTVALMGWTPEECLENIRNGMSDLLVGLSDRERAIDETTLQGLLDVMAGVDASGGGDPDGRNAAAHNFHIHPEPGLAPGVTSEIRVDIPQANRIGYQVMPSIASYMLSAAEHAEGADNSMIWYRGGLIGISSQGPYLRWASCQNALDHVLTGSAKELVLAGENLAIGAGYLSDADGWSRDALKGHRDELSRGETGWDNSESNLDVQYTPYGTAYPGSGG